MGGINERRIESYLRDEEQERSTGFQVKEGIRRQFFVVVVMG